MRPVVMALLLAGASLAKALGAQGSPARPMVGGPDSVGVTGVKGSEKDPEVAVVIGMLAAGGGQLYAGRYVKGAALLATEVVGVTVFLAGPGYRCDGSQAVRGVGEEPSNSGCRTGSYTTVYAGLGVAALAWTVGVLTARQDATSHNAALGRHAMRLRPFIAGREVGVALSR